MPPKVRADKDKTDKGTPNATVSEDTVDHKCGKCTKAMSDSDDGINCEICGLWLHCKCQGIVEQMYRAMIQFKDNFTGSAVVVRQGHRSFWL